MRLGLEEKKRLVARYYNGESVAEICSDSGVARSTFLYLDQTPYLSKKRGDGL